MRNKHNARFLFSSFLDEIVQGELADDCYQKMYPGIASEILLENLIKFVHDINNRPTEDGIDHGKLYKKANGRQIDSSRRYYLVKEPNLDEFNLYAKITKGRNLVRSLRASLIDIHPNARWQQDGVTVAGGNRLGNGINQLSNPWGLYVDDEQTVYVADQSNHRIMEWKSGTRTSQVVAGGNGKGSGAHQLFYPQDVIVDKATDSLIICDSLNHRVVR
ncbi:unnamed protein product [Rotaria sp. Silwood2]|nr:unnamed protein product [Rotaria sp. Silwood2]